ncbi:signal transduction histidine kinase [Anaerotaenia torta]|uniref:sensor histidine kinase n=1 Tax=Anaerotaenia torta TaxID=433293 RepID=UPI003D203968
MINQLQRKFIMITMASLCLVMVLLVGAINIINFYRTDLDADRILQMLSENKGKFPEFDRGMEPPRDKRPGFEMNEEAKFQTRYFYVKLDEGKEVEEINTSHISAVGSGDALDYAEEVLDLKKTSGYKGNYKYRIIDTPDGSMIIFLDVRNQMQMVMYFFLTSCGVALGTLLLVFILVSVFSKRAIHPIVQNMEKQKRFITDAGHEIKTPIAIISANADVLELTSGENEWIISIRNQTARLDKLVKNLLLLSRMEEENIEITYQDFDMSQCVQSIAASFLAVAESQHKKLDIDVVPHILLHGDEGCIEQLVSALLDNAMKYSNDRGVIRISLSPYKRGSKLEVYNTAEHVETKDLDRFFDRFYRADESRSRETGGYGIGLSMVKSIVEAHHGRISIHSNDGRSVVFTVIL